MTELTIKASTLLAEIEEQSGLRNLKTSQTISPTIIQIDGKKLVNFASNDYLGLSRHPTLIECAIKAIEKYGVGCPSSRLVSGNSQLYSEIENKLAKLKSTEAAIVFPTGFQTNFTVLHGLSKLNSFFFCDELSHHSLLLGAQLKPKCFNRFAHNNVDEINSLLRTKKASNTSNNWIVTESVFSMDGDLAPVNELARLSKETKSYFYLDEAHAIGVFGDNGMGLLNKPDERTITMGTFSKGCGSFGAYITCSNVIKEFLVNFCSGLIYTTALPPSVLASIEASLDIIPNMVLERKRLLNNADALRTELNSIGFDTGKSESQIISLYLKTNDLALSLSNHLEECGIYARAIRPPTVPKDTARIRISLSLAHSNLEIEQLIKALKVWYANKH